MIIQMSHRFVLPSANLFFTDFSRTELIINNLTLAVRKLDYKDCKNRSGCYVAFYDRVYEKLHAAYFGPPPVNNEIGKLKYLQCATEKVTRMARYHLHTSFERLDEANERFGGGVSFNDTLFIACSGYPPEIDEAVSYIIGLKKISIIENVHGIISLNDISKTKNDFIAEILKLS